MQNKYYIYIR